MGSEWREALLEDIASEVTVGFVGSMTSEYVESGVSFLRSKNIDHLTINTEDLKFISQKFNEKIRKSKLAPGDVVIVRTGKPGVCAVIPDWLEEANCSDLVIVRCGPDVNCKFLAYYINTSASSHVLAHIVGAVQQHFNVGAAKKMKVLLPPLVEQVRIVRVLGALDDKIDLNRQMNTTLESMAQALFKSWFVDFDPVIDKALAAGNSIPEPLHARAEARKALGDQRKPLPAAIQQQFPDRFVFTEEMGWVPEGWESVPLVEFGRIVCGKTPSKSKSEYFGEDAPFIKIPDMHTSMFVVDPIEKLSKLGVASQAKKSVPRGTVCVSCIATVGKVVIATTESQTNQQINSVVPRAEYLTPYLYFYMLSLEKLFHGLASGGSATLNMNTSTFSKVGVLKPSEALMKLYGNSVQAQLSKIEINQKETMTLIRLRDTLLPKLLSGELRVPKAEATVASTLAEESCN